MKEEFDPATHEQVTVRTGVYYRSAEMSVRKTDDGQDVYEFAFSSEAPVAGRLMWVEDQERYVYGTEVLKHGRENVDMSWIASGAAPFLKDHSMSQQAGVILGAKLDEASKELRVTGLRFSRSQIGQDIKNDIDDGIRRNVSVGYMIEQVVEAEPPQRDTQGVYHVTRWKPYEVSSVSIPADETVGFRSADDDREFSTVLIRSRGEGVSTAQTTNHKPQGEEGMENPETINRGGSAPEPEVKNLNVTVGKTDAERISMVADLNREAFPAGIDIATEAISEGQSFDDFRSAFMPKLKEAQEAKRQQAEKDAKRHELGMSEKEVSQYRLMNVANALANPHSRQAQEAAAYELELSTAAAKTAGKDARGIVIPVDVLRGSFDPRMQGRELTVAGDGQYFKQTNVLGGSFIDFLDAQTRVIQAGATVLRDLSGSVSIPRRDAEMVGGWVAESGDTAEKTPSYDAVTLSDKTYGMHVKISRQMRLQSSVDVEMLVRRDMATGMALGIDRGALYGSGSSNEPTGLINTTGVNTVTLGGAHAPTYANVVDMETAITEDNALVDGASLSWLIHPTLIGALKKTVITSGDATTILGKNESGLIGYPIFGTTNAIASSVKRMILGNWSDLLIGMWGGLDVIVDPYSSSSDGTLKLVIFQDCDIAVRHPESFCISVNPS